MSSPSSPERAMLPPAALAIHLDCLGGMAGDMFVAAVVDALPALEASLLATVSAVAPPGAPPPRMLTTTRAGLHARHFGLQRARVPEVIPRAGHGRSYAELKDIIERAPLPPTTRTHALGILHLLGRAEARVHGVDLDRVHFHELADWDSLLDVVAAGHLAAELDGALWSASSLPLGAGRVRTAHGMLPVPAPATALLLEGYAWHDDGVGGERVTPTGAAILRHLVAPERCGAARATGRLRGVGHGAGTRDSADLPNIVRATVFERAAMRDDETVAVLEFDLDDMTGEEIGLACERLRAHPGVLDVTVGVRQGKKSRPVSDVRLLASPVQIDDVITACLAETSTLGLRVREDRRRTLSRAHASVDVDGRTVRVKLATRPDGTRTAKAEHDALAGSAQLAERRDLAQRAERRALDDEDA